MATEPGKPFSGVISGSRKFRQVCLEIYLVTNVFHGGLYGPPSRSSWASGPIASRGGGSVPIPLVAFQGVQTMGLVSNRPKSDADLII